jgi:hypothetical protein
MRGTSDLMQMEPTTVWGRVGVNSNMDALTPLDIEPLDPAARAATVTVGCCPLSHSSLAVRHIGDGSTSRAQGRFGNRRQIG